MSDPPIQAAAPGELAAPADVRRLGPSALRLPASTGIVVATGVLFLVSWIAQPQILHGGPIEGMLPFAAVLAIVAAGQTLVIQQGGIDLSAPGVISLTTAILTHYPATQNSKLPVALLMVFGLALAAGLVNGITVSRIGITPIVTTLGMNALLYGAVLSYSGGTPRDTTPDLYSFANSKVWVIPTTILLAVGIVGVTSFAVKYLVVGRRFEAVGANAVASRAAGIEATRYRLGAYVAATLLYCMGGTLLAGVIKTPSWNQGDYYLLTSVAAVVLGGTSLLGGSGSVVASAIGALFLTQLEQLVLTTGAKTGIQYLIEAGAVAGGVAVYGVRWNRLRQRIGFSRRRPEPVGSSP